MSDSKPRVFLGDREIVSDGFALRAFDDPRPSSPACEVDGGACSVALTEWCEINAPPFRPFDIYPKRGEQAFMVTAEGAGCSVVPIRSTRSGWICGPFHDYRFVSSPELASALGWLTEEELRLFLPVYAPKESR